jgi:PAS domain S-box-containing protein
VHRTRQRLHAPYFAGRESLHCHTMPEALTPSALLPPATAAQRNDDGDHLRALIDNVGDIIGRFDRDCRYIYVSPSVARYTGQGPEHFIGKTHEELGFSLEERERWDSVIRRVMQSGVAEELELTADFGSNRRLFQWRVAPEIDDAGVVRSVVTVARDITESRHAELRLAAYSTRMQEMARRLVQAHEAERYNIAGDLHDLLGQNLTALGINLDIVRSELPADVPAHLATRLARMKSLVDETIESVRIALKDLRPHTLEEYGLVAGLHSYANHFCNDRQFSVAVSTHGPERRMTPAVELALFRIVQEAVANAARHSGAPSVRVELNSETDRMRLVIEDDGRGFRTDVERRTRTRSLGLMLMQERADAAGVSLSVESSPGCGTRICVEVSGKALEWNRDGIN